MQLQLFCPLLALLHLTTAAPIKLPRLAYVKGVNAREILIGKEHGTWEEANDPEESTLVWLRNHRMRRKKFVSNPIRQIYNKLPTSTPMTDKANLFINVNQYESTNNLKHTTCMPKTFPLVTQDDVESFLADPEIKKGVWIFKQTKESMGMGITIHDSSADQWWNSTAMVLVKRKVKSGTRYVVQRYIQNPLLLEGRKCELRLYWAVVSLEPLIAVVYKVGQARINSMAYVNEDYSNPLKHLTNIFQQKKHPDYDRLSKSGALKWSLDQFEAYLTGELKHSPEAVQHALSTMKQCLLRVANSTSSLMTGDDEQKGFGRFELFGADFILDSNLKVYLTEVQQGPGLSINDPVKARVLRPAIQRLADLALEIQEKRLNGLPLTNLNLTGSGYEYLAHAGMEPPFYREMPHKN
eukprot:TRINITY_DN15731_c0_g1_i1.p1 TRINITY_DN15731_c0_g1~~TRINITY_DN15731_c0_g1_i1.p1  ORF type:complete len:410 (+),score=40.72 TRINITY_DN15731_c0_g1_i1:46-1275(+)